MCHSSGRPPTSNIGFGVNIVASDILVPNPPASMTAFNDVFLELLVKASTVPVKRATATALFPYCHVHKEIHLYVSLYHSLLRNPSEEVLIRRIRFNKLL